ncbi:MAG: 30S ribosomal protein S1 [Saprospiraceae bacterium]|nr:30S ribosomal protein S1 [Saprospiraceae bacterium]
MRHFFNLLTTALMLIRAYKPGSIMSDEKNLENEKPVETPTEEVVETPIEESTEEKTAESTTEKSDSETPEQVEIEIEDENSKLAESPHDDYDWSIGNKHTLAYSEEEINDYLADYDKSLNSISEFELVSGKVSAISDGNVLLDINYKSDGLVPLTEFRDTPDLKVGDKVEVYIEAKEDIRGQLQLSRRKAKLINAWDSLVDSFENGTIIKGSVISKTKGGLIVDVGGLETFLPGSQIDIKPIIDYDSYVGKTMEFKVVKINEVIKNAVVSHKALIESDLAEQRESIISGLEKGQVLEGLVKNITDFGAFMDLGGVDGLLYITDISWGRINHPQEVLELNQKLNVVVLDFDEDKKRISLGLKQLQPHPWEVLPQDVVEGSSIKGKIVNIEDYGAFLEIIPGVEGLIHVSEVTWSNQPVNAREYFFLGQEFEAKVVTIDREERKMSLSIKQLLDDPWVKVIDQYPVDSKHSGEVKNLTPYGVFVELQEGVGGMVHISDLSWTKRYSHPSEFTKVGDNIDVVILEVDKESRKLSLGHKQLEENPWDTFENVFPVGSYHEATVIKREDRGAIVQLPYGLEAFAPFKHIKKENGQNAEVDEILTVKVIEFNRDDKRIIVSHLRYLEDIKREAEGEVRRERDQERRKTRSAVKRQNTKVEGTTLGDLGVFSELKGAFDAPVPPPKKKKEEPVVEKKVEEVAEKKAKEVAEDKAEPVAEKVVEEVKEPVVEAVAEETAETVAEVPAEEPAKKAKAKKASTKKDDKDDLRKIEGIGPKIAEIMANGGVATFEDMANADVEKLKEILAEAGPRYKMHNPETWPQQASLAAKGDWDALKILQDELDGGRK